MRFRKFVKVVLIIVGAVTATSLFWAWLLEGDPLDNTKMQSYPSRRPHNPEGAS